jgi:hypothetical protein
VRDATSKGVIFDFDGQVLSRGIELVEKGDQASAAASIRRCSS